MMDLESLKKKYKETYKDSNFSEVDKVSSGILGIDVLTGGGIPVGRIIEISGSESTSKTLISLTIASAYQKRGQLTALVDCERTTTKKDIIRAGMDPEAGNFFYFTPRNGEQALDIIKDLAESGVSLIIVDSVPYIKPEKSLEKETGSATMADVARLLGSEQTQLTNAADDNDCTILFINQVRAKLTGYGGNQTAGGYAIKYMFSLRLQNRIESIKKDKSGVTLEIKTLKNKVGSPYGITFLDVDFVEGKQAVDVYSSFRVEAQRLGWIEQKGAYFYLKAPYAQIFFNAKPNEKITLGQGANKVREFLESNEEAYSLMYEKILEEIKGSFKIDVEELDI
jgi:recombination protein RecA